MNINIVNLNSYNNTLSESLTKAIDLFDKL
jgi:hypothetical protein